LREPDPLKAIVGFSGFLPDRPALDGAVKSRPPVCLVHGDADPVVPYQMGLAARDRLEALGVPVAFHTSPGVAHSIAPDGLEFAGAFLNRLQGAEAVPER
jgi:phospholipase/carboxylesterase